MFPDDPTWTPSERPFDLGPFACYRVPEGAETMRLDRWIMKNVCSNWNAAQKLVSAKQVWVVPPDHSTEQHRKSVMIPRFRPETQGSTPLAPFSYVYFPKVMRPMSKRRVLIPRGQEPPGWLLERVLYKDTDFLVIDKPAGWSMQPGRKIGDMHLQRLLPSLQFGLEQPPKFVHRLSTELSGVLLLARHQAAAAYAKDMVRQRAFWQRSFWGVACGRTPQTGTVSLPLKQVRHREREISQPMREVDGGQPALTEFRTVMYSPLASGMSLLEMNLYTGRFHQSRAHCAFGLRAPLLGDPIYYDFSNRINSETAYKVHYHSEEAKRERAELLGGMPELHLHSRQLRLKTFAGKDILVTAPLPEHMRKTFEVLGWSEFLKREDREAEKMSSWNRDEDPHVQEALAYLRETGELREGEWRPRRSTPESSSKGGRGGARGLAWQPPPPKKNGLGRAAGRASGEGDDGPSPFDMIGNDPSGAQPRFADEREPFGGHYSYSEASSAPGYYGGHALDSSESRRYDDRGDDDDDDQGEDPYRAATAPRGRGRGRRPGGGRRHGSAQQVR